MDELMSPAADDRIPAFLIAEGQIPGEPVPSKISQREVRLFQVEIISRSVRQYL